MRIIPFIACSSIELYANTYLLIDSKDRCVVIDPGKDYSGVKDFILENSLSLRGILLTHGHFDHIRGVKLLSDFFSTDTYIAKEDEEYLKDIHLNGSDRFSLKKIVIDVETKPLEDGQFLDLLDEKIEVMKTPYHTAGSVCFYLPNSKVLFSGDSLFKGNVGRMDFPGSRPDLFHQSINKILALPNDTVIYPGHGENTTIAQEKLFSQNSDSFVL